MNLLRGFMKMLGGGSGARRSGDVGMYYYLRCDRCGEVIRVRISPLSDLSHTDDDKGLFSHKVIVGRRCFNRIEAEFDYDRNHKLIESRATGGKFTDLAAWKADQQQHPEQPAPTQ